MSFDQDSFRQGIRTALEAVREANGTHFRTDENSSESNTHFAQGWQTHKNLVDKCLDILEDSFLKEKKI